MTSHRARTKLADALADIKNNKTEDTEIAPTPPKRRSNVNYLALSGHRPRQRQNTNQEKNHTVDQVARPVTINLRKTHVKIFDRSVDIVLQDESPSLYTLCRLWVKGNRAPTDQTQITQTENSADVFSLPPPRSKNEIMKEFSIEGDEEQIDLRFPPSCRNFKPSHDVDKKLDESISTMSVDQTLEENKVRWRKIRNDWLGARMLTDARYEESFAILTEICNTDLTA